MLLPLFGFVFGAAGSACLGAVVMAIHPSWKLTLRNLSFFVVGAFAAALGSSLRYTWLFANETQHFQAGAFAIGMLATLCVATLSGGTFATFLGRRFFGPAEEGPGVEG